MCGRFSTTLYYRGLGEQLKQKFSNGRRIDKDDSIKSPAVRRIKTAELRRNVNSNLLL